MVRGTTRRPPSASPLRGGRRMATSARPSACLPPHVTALDERFHAQVRSTVEAPPFE